MRQIKFRAWDKVCECYVKSMWCMYSNGSISIDQTWATGDIELEQFTGLLDSEGNEIYEGDIVTDDDCILGIVHYVTNSNSIYAGQYILTDGFGFAIDDPDLEDCDRWGRVCGNIHQNPELLDNAEQPA